jgi:hypothetical protein
MSTRLSFDVELTYADDPSGIAIPIFVGFGVSVLRDSAEIDTGAEVCLFRQELAEELGIALEAGVPKTLNTLAGSLECFGHEVTIYTNELAFQSLIYFAKYPGLPRNILGRQGWLRNLRLAVIDYDDLLYLSAYDS